MKNNEYFGALMVLALPLHSCIGTRAVDGDAAVTSVSRGVWQYAPVIIDVYSSDRTEPLFFNDATTAVAYSFTNDDKNLYMVLKTGEPGLQARLYKGLQLRLSTKKGDRDGFQLRYPLPAEETKSSPGKGDTTAKRLPVGDTGIYALCGSRTCNGLHFCSGTNNGLQVRLSCNDKGETVCEVQVPFALFYKEELSAADGGKPVYCETTIGGFAKSSRAYAPPLRDDANRPATLSGTAGDGAVQNTRMKTVVSLVILANNGPEGCRAVDSMR